MVKLYSLGAAQEVGRSGFVLDTGSEKLLMDYGIKAISDMNGTEQPEFPKEAPIDIDAALISHAHMDHGGWVPSLYKRGWKGPTYSTATSFELMGLLLRDSVKLAKLFNHEIHYWTPDIETMQRNSFRVAYGQAFDVGQSMVSYHDAGHIPGSAQILVENPNGNFVYSGDIKEEPTELLKGLKHIDTPVNALITESTYGMREHPNRENTEKELIRIARETIHQDGHVLISSFAVGRSQELLLALEKFGGDIPIYLDGMCKGATEIALKYSEFLRYPDMLKRAYSHATKIENEQMRKRALKEPSIIVTTSGMLNGGPIEFYLNRLKNDTKSHLIMTGYQAHGCSGRHLMDTGNEYKNKDKQFKLKMPWTKLDFSAHAGQHELLDYFKKMNPEHIVCVHGDSTPEFAEYLEQEHGFKASAPAIGDVLQF